MANGYAIGDKELSNEYLMKKIENYVLFVVRWLIIIAIPVLLVTRNLRNVLSLTKGIISGSGYLFALWFVPALCLIYIAIIIRNLIKGSPLRFSGGLKQFIAAVVILIVDYLTNRILLHITGYEIRDIILPPFRVFISFGYFSIGMELKVRLAERKIRHREKIFALLSMFSGLIFLAFATVATNIIWASSFYGSPFIVVACVGLFILCISLDDRLNDIIMLFSTQTTGIWVIHPFVIRVYNKVIGMAFPILPSESALFLFLRLAVALIISFIVSFVLHRFTISSRLVDVSVVK